MDTMFEMLTHRHEHLVGRVFGPLNFRLVIMPLVVTMLAIRAHLRDVREGRPTDVLAFFRDPTERRRLFRSGLKDFGKVFIVACVLDTTYQIWVLRSFYLGELLVVAVVCAIVPYLLVRGPITRIVRLLYRKWAKPADQPAANPAEDTKGRRRTETMKLLRRYLPILDWGTKYSHKTFDALTATSILGKRAGKNVPGCAA